MIGPPHFAEHATTQPLIPAVAPAKPAAVHLNSAAAEREIARLTWAVLDGSATLADRQRLGELVRAQHAARRRAV
jgi:hypothetical protein